MNLITLTWTGTYEDLKQLYIAHIESDAILGDDVQSKAEMVFGLMQHLTLNNNIKAKGTCMVIFSAFRCYAF